MSSNGLGGDSETDGRTDKPFGPSPEPEAGRRKKNVVTHPIHMSNSRSKFCWISSYGLGGDSVTVGRAEAIAIPPPLFLKKRGEKCYFQSTYFFYSSLMTTFFKECDSLFVI